MVYSVRYPLQMYAVYIHTAAWMGTTLFPSLLHLFLFLLVFLKSLSGRRVVPLVILDTACTGKSQAWGGSRLAFHLHEDWQGGDSQPLFLVGCSVAFYWSASVSVTRCSDNCVRGRKGRWNEAFRAASSLLLGLSGVGAHPPPLLCYSEPLGCSCALMAGGEGGGKKVVLHWI